MTQPDFSQMSAERRRLELVRVSQALHQKDTEALNAFQSKQAAAATAATTCVDALIAAGLVPAAKKAELTDHLSDHAETLKLFARFASRHQQAMEEAAKSAAATLGTPQQPTAPAPASNSGSSAMSEHTQRWLQELGYKS